MNIYDFDKTIYDGDSSVEFFKYCLKRNKKCLLVIPKSLIMIGLYLLKIIEKEKMKSAFFSIVKYFDDIDKVVEDFWKFKNYKLKNYYLKQRKKGDVIVSASPEFLLYPISKKYGFKLIATDVDKKTGILLGNNCYGEEKVKRLKKEDITKCDNFYSDSLSDTPSSKLAKNAYIVNGEELILWNEYRETFFKKLKHTFFSRDFITFVAIGVINTFNGVWIAYVYSLFIKDAVLAYVCGFLTSLCISYLLNSILNFKDKLSLKKLGKFAISNIPNFLVQVFSVVVLIKLLELLKLISYMVSAIVAVPITFVLVKFFVYKKK